MSTKENLPPNYAKLDTALRSVGYSFEAAVADIIDNSIDAGAETILVRVILRAGEPLDIVIWDDGQGMDSATLKEAMRFGADVTKEVERLGKFGLGLKLASLSQARELRTISRKSGELSGRGWLEEGINRGFESSVFDYSECEKMLADLVPDLKWKKSGTLIWWSHLYRVGQNHEDPDAHAQNLIYRLKDFLSVAFHRFLAGRPRKVKIILDQFNLDGREAGVPFRLTPLNPFGYERSGVKGFPSELVLKGDFAGKLTLNAHIWPPNSAQPEYRLPGGSNSRQGFYFYRNNRLIQGGGWNGLREPETHMSLARIEVEIASDMDVDVHLSLDVKKVQIQLPQKLVYSIKSAKTAEGIDFTKYLRAADEAYRTKPVTEAELPLIPSKGLPDELGELLRKELRSEKTNRFRKVNFDWKKLDADLFFSVDRDNDIIYINSMYRRKLLHNFSHLSDVPVIKVLLFLILRKAITSAVWGSKIREEVEEVNRILVLAARFE